VRCPKILLEELPVYHKPEELLDEYLKATGLDTTKRNKL